MSKIFISMAALHEKFVYETVTSAIENADNPRSLSFGIFVQQSEEKVYNFEKISNRINCIVADAKYILGVGGSRLSASVLRQYDEDFYLQIDSHLIFTKGWDTILLNRYNNLLKTNKKPIISMGGPGWFYENEKIVLNGKTNGVLIASPKLDSSSTSGNIVFGTSLFSETQESLFCTAQFMFSDISILDEVSPDPFILFEGEEPTFSLRVCTRGYKIFAIEEVIFYHLDKTKNPEFNWREIPKLRFSEERMYFSRKRVRDVMLGKILGYWGAPDKQSLDEYYSKINVDVKGFFQKYE
jgi:hypothetical protein